MTTAERALIESLDKYVREWRGEDQNWKGDTDKRLAKVERYIAVQEALIEQAAKTGTDKRARLGVFIAALGAIGSLAIGILNALR